MSCSETLVSELCAAFGPIPITKPLSNQILTCNIRAFLGSHTCLTLTGSVTTMTPKVLRWKAANYIMTCLRYTYLT